MHQPSILERDSSATPLPVRSLLSCQRSFRQVEDTCWSTHPMARGQSYSKKKIGKASKNKNNTLYKSWVHVWYTHTISHTHRMDETRTGTIASLQSLDPNANHARGPKTKKNSHRADLKHTNKNQWQNVQKKTQFRNQAGKSSKSLQCVSTHPKTLGTAKITSQRWAFQEIDAPHLRRKHCETGRYENPNESTVLWGISWNTRICGLPFIALCAY